MKSLFTHLKFRPLAQLAALSAILSGCGPAAYTPPSDLATQALASDLQALSGDVQSLKSEQGLLFEQLEDQRRDESALGPNEKPVIDEVRRCEEGMLALGRQVEAIKLQQGANIEQLRNDLGKLKSGVESLARALTLSPEQGSSTAEALASGTYIVRAGDTLDKIAKRLRVSVDSLRRCNRINGDLIVSGQKLAVPSTN